MNFIYFNRNRRDFLKIIGTGAMGLFMSGCLSSSAKPKQAKRRPNILLAISDDQSWMHTGINSPSFMNTPNYNKVAENGVLFENCYCPAPQCSPSRAALLTGRNIWQLEEAGTHGSYFPRKFEVYTELLENSGYYVGYTGKPWAPGNWKDMGWEKNPAGTEYNDKKIDNPPTSGISNNDYSGNFKDFLSKRPEGSPFCFWYGCHEPHRSYEYGSGAKAGKNLEDVKRPAFLPEDQIVRNDILDYAFEIEWFDKHLGNILQTIEQAGELDNTLVIITSDNGMPFPRSKANLYEYGTRVPLAIMWADKIKAGRVVEDFVSFIDFAPTFLDAAGLEQTGNMTGKSLMNVLLSNRSGLVDRQRNWVVTGRERHTHARPDNLGYPCRAIRMDDFLYIYNFAPDRWPAGDPYGFYDVDGSPSKSLLIERKDDEEIRVHPVNE